ncbi:hypothetical protein GCM10027168_03140 [Streptomyces capparidis]
MRRFLPPLSAAVLATACAGGAWLSDDALVLRVLIAAAAVAACAGAVLLRRRDRAAEKEISRLRSARLRDEWHTEDRIAELEQELEETRDRATALGRKLNAKRSELARLRGEHASLLRRYATAEAERAAALESARVAAEPGPAPALSPSLFLRANAALEALGRGAGRPPESPAEAPEASRAPEPITADGGREADEREADRPVDAPVTAEAPADTENPAPAAEAAPEERPDAASPAHERAPAHPGAAVAVLPPQLRTAPRRPEPGFDFFGTKRTAAAAAGEAAEHEDLADVIGAELAHDDADVIDLTEHDETETIDVRELRALS